MLHLVLVLHVAIILNFSNKRAPLMSGIFFYSNRVVDAKNSLPNTVLSASSTKKKLREVDLDRFLTIVERFLFLSLSLFFSVLYCIFMCILYVLAAYRVA